MKDWREHLLALNFPDPVDRAKREQENQEEDDALREARKLLGQYAFVDRVSPPGGYGVRMLGKGDGFGNSPLTWLGTGDSWKAALAEVRAKLAAGMIITEYAYERSGVSFHGAEVSLPHKSKLPRPAPDAILDDEDTT